MEKRRGSGIVRVSDLFQTYHKRLKAPEGSVITAFIELIHDLYGITIKREWCEYRPGTRTLFLRAPGAVKSELLTHTPEILTHLKARLGERSYPTTLI